ncbi:MAG TPA: prepilin-type N-terminal cleavage/methylation domain-containing protein [Pyrinomonadaceae bacterium]|jgi:prepilin-type N-terminal cleavage/methylation domain-containing protein
MKNEKGFSLFELLLVLVLIAVVAAIAVPSLINSRKTARETKAASYLSAIHVAQRSFWATNGNTYSTLTELNNAGLLPAGFTGAGFTFGGYAFSESVTTDNTQGYCAKASPLTASDGTRHFGVDQMGKVYESAVAADIACSGGVLTVGASAVAVNR